MLNILYEDAHLLALNKPPGMPVQPDPSGDASLLDLANRHCGVPVHLAHRLDRPVSGAVLFAKTAHDMTMLTDQFRQQTVEKTYLAVVQGVPPEEEGDLIHFIRKSKTGNKSTLHTEPSDGLERAELHYRVKARMERYILLEVQPLGGKHHQIRAQLAAVGCPVRGDVKYGARRGNADRSIQLHAWKIAFDHPGSWERLALTAEPPDLAVWEKV